MSCVTLLTGGLKRRFHSLQISISRRFSRRHNPSKPSSKPPTKIHRNQIGLPQDVRKAADPLGSLSALLGEVGTPEEQALLRSERARLDGHLIPTRPSPLSRSTTYDSSSASSRHTNTTSHTFPLPATSVCNSSSPTIVAPASETQSQQSDTDTDVEDIDGVAVTVPVATKVVGNEALGGVVKRRSRAGEGMAMGPGKEVYSARGEVFELKSFEGGRGMNVQAPSVTVS